MDQRRKSKPSVAPVYYTVEQFADACGVAFGKGSKRKGETNVQKARRWLITQGAAVKRGRLWFTTKALIRNAFPEGADAICSALSELCDT